MAEKTQEPGRFQAPLEEVDHGMETDVTSYAQSASFAVRLRVIILLALICWAVLIAGVILIT